MSKRSPIKRNPIRDAESKIPIDLASQIEAEIRSIYERRSDVKTGYLLEQMMSKFVSEDTDPAELRRSRALLKWLVVDRENKSTNDRLFVTPGEYNILPRVSYRNFVSWCRTYIARLIGEVVPVEAFIGSFSGGASTSRKRTESQPDLKYLGKAHATSDMARLFADFGHEEFPVWFDEGHSPSVEEVSGNVFFTVPKKTDIDRCACKEPDLNMFIQKGAGTFLRNRLRHRAGINLNDQSINRSLAREGSATGKLATLDLSSASDSVTEGLVRLLLPVNWYTFLDSCRSRVTVIDGEEHRNQMFSSMGNGFTFELESLLFLTLVRGVQHFIGSPGVVSVYGDDIICPADISPDVEWVLQYFGFTVNSEKSFAEGPFRESCGGHYWNGYDITPFYIKKPIRTLPDLIDVANKLRWWCLVGNPALGILDPEFEPLWLRLKQMVPSCLWGGRDTTFKYQLVSNDEPSMRLQQKVVKRDTGTGGYLQWLNATWDRVSVGEAVVTSRSTRTLDQFRLRKARRNAVNTLPALWLSELQCW